MNVFFGILESACLSVRASVCVQNTSFSQSAGGDIKSHLETALVNSVPNRPVNLSKSLIWDRLASHLPHNPKV